MCCIRGVFGMFQECWICAKEVSDPLHSVSWIIVDSRIWKYWMYQFVWVDLYLYSEKNGILGSRVPPFFGKTWKRSKSGKILQRLNLLKNFKRLKIFCKIPWKYTLKIQRNTGGTNMQNPEKYSKFGRIFRKSWKIQVRPKRSSFHFGRNIRKNAQNASFIEIDRDILKNYKTRKNTSKHQNTPENTDNAPQKTGSRRTNHFFQLCMQGRQ